MWEPGPRHQETTNIESGDAHWGHPNGDAHRGGTGLRPRLPRRVLANCAIAKEQQIGHGPVGPARMVEENVEASKQMVPALGVEVKEYQDIYSYSYSCSYSSDLGGVRGLRVDAHRLDRAPLDSQPGHTA